MAEDLVKIKRRIASISSTRKITNAMELVSSAKLRKKKKMMENVKDYTNIIESILLDLLTKLDEKGKFPLLKLTKINENATNDLYVLVNSDLGLCGGYNYNLLKCLNEHIKEGDTVLFLGSHSINKIDPLKYVINTTEMKTVSNFDYRQAGHLSTLLEQVYLDGKYKNIFLVYTSYKNALTFVPTCEKILPLEKPTSHNVEKYDNSFEEKYLPNKEEVFELLVPKYLNTILFEKICEGLVSEEGERRNAMKGASDNADELLKNLSLKYNKARQGQITSEITEIVSGRINDNN